MNIRPNNSQNLFILNIQKQHFTSADMETLTVILFCFTLIGNTMEDDITASSAEEFSSEGRSVTLSCTYSVKAQNLQWYRQDPGSAPQFLLLITDTKPPSVVEAKPPHPRLTATLNEERNQVDLQISSAEVSDSAVYYCALNNNQKMIFGRGTRLNIEPYEDIKPSIYKLSGTDTTACLATGFSRHNETKDPTQAYSDIFSKTAPAVRISGDSLYNQVAILSGKEDENQCVESTVDSCDDNLKPDPKVNYVTLIVLGLRLLFLKTIAFNVLLTLRLWISQ